ncbi:MAG: hypothetical protein ACJ79S_21020 [Gemmatimonadaceae bacterium]
MAATAPLAMPRHVARAERVFPTLSAAQMARIAPHGSMRQVERGDVLLAPEVSTVRLFVVVTGRLEAVRSSDQGETVVATLG